MSTYTEKTDYPDHLLPFADQVDDLRRVGKMCWKRGWSLGTSSNYSVVVQRDPLLLLVTASGKDKGHLQRDDFVLVRGQDGTPACPGQPKSSAETLLHCVAAEDETVGAVLHTHSIWSTILSERFCPQSGILIEGFEMLKGLNDVTTHEHAQWLPIFQNTQDIPALAEQVRQEMRHPQRPMRHGYLILRHGLYTWGKDLDEARRQLEVLEFLLECLGRQASLK
jgi:methylthioribulose-1-phosphate dehydratase